MNHLPVLLFSPINTNLATPCLGVSLLKAGLESLGIRSKVYYLNILFYEVLGRELFLSVHSGSLFNLSFERIFAPFAHEGIERGNLNGFNGEEVSDDLQNYYRIMNCLNKDLTSSMYSKIETRCEAFIERAVCNTINLRPKIIGFSNFFQQTNLSIALAKAIRKVLPDAVLAVGGNNCDGEMGAELADSMPVFDYIFRGEAEFVFPRFCRDYIENNKLPEQRLITCPYTDDLDSLPIPDYTDYFEQTNLPDNHITLSFESSRGCWWGQKQQCKFCGECIMEIRYREKSPDRMINELRQLQLKYPGTKNYFATDSVFPNSYLKDFIPKLKHENIRTEIITYEVRAHLSKEDLKQMREAGINRIFPGIETLSTRLLKLMNKGTNSILNVCLLRNCREVGITVTWLFLVGIPGDMVSDYNEQVRIIPFLQHLNPPSFSPVRIPRFSPYFNEPAAHKITDVNPIRPYAYAFPDTVNLHRIAYFFEGKFPSESRSTPEVLIPLVNLVEIWTESWRRQDPPRLSIRPLDDGKWMVEDSRDSAKSPVQILNKEEYSVLEQCRKGALPEHINKTAICKKLVSLGYLLQIDQNLLSVVCKE